MLRGLIIATAIAVSALAMGPAAEAKTNIQIHLGVPFYSYQVGPGWRYYDGYGWYDYRRHGDIRDRRHNRLTCAQARRLVSRSGYRIVRTVQCNGRVYVFRAVNRNGKQVNVRVNSRTRAIF
jgi:hypothetical protein